MYKLTWSSLLAAIVCWLETKMGQIHLRWYSKTEPTALHRSFPSNPTLWYKVLSQWHRKLYCRDELGGPWQHVGMSNNTVEISENAKLISRWIMFFLILESAWICSIPNRRAFYLLVKNKRGRKAMVHIEFEGPSLHQEIGGRCWWTGKVWWLGFVTLMQFHRKSEGMCSQGHLLEARLTVFTDVLGKYRSKCCQM